MAELGDSLIKGDLRVLGKIYAESEVYTLEQFNALVANKQLVPGRIYDIVEN